MAKNINDRPTIEEIRNNGAIPFASQIPNDSPQGGDSVGEVLTLQGAKGRVMIDSLAIDTLNDEQTANLGGDAADEFCPITAIIQMIAVVGAAASGDFEITIGITPGGTEILGATACTGVIDENDKLPIDLSGVALNSIPANSDIYVKVTTADTTAGAGHLARAYLVGELIPKA